MKTLTALNSGEPDDFEKSYWRHAANGLQGGLTFDLEGSDS
jgi:hypothetical protein